ncbi:MULTISPECIES: response regulator transcription factor [Streptomyces]|jgi:DNA-binding CsgD family transcriptional regulator|uniref:LuxR C-terminal-related transcriptional regulator n=1 Tax=Streptomyces mirabilis TaxID=68239 RepID=A0ABU3UJZ7_9ACTN|nr:MULTISPECIES: LuxR C-terminal-related transcriptional regulator [Streptomyces]KAF5994244.1 helix-turn-helix transcriptional regulator [Streptomyces sp. WAC00263]MCX4612430.1 LuxR C-terminal-related transcriptional regulator [Streptomyces mirabilis]MCX5352654.1 LuxR C-terminal-related transcriptional regulator [Streptomyces mirabilis]MDU8993864.1 LuxR C-terminal-related transcriptional regulator [Streptomyces mirabilis]NMI61615.1 helix-turn-helix transcriptional regulator [Streptomyces sp. R
MVNTAYDTARETPAASPWAAVGVSAFDELLYQAILNQPDAGAAGWALLTGASPARVREACNRLLTLGLLQPPDSMGGLRAVDPRVAIRALIRRRETESELLAATAEEMATAYEAGLLREEPSRLVEVASGEGAIAARLEEMYARAEHEVCLFDTPPYLAPPAPQVDLQADLLSRGIVSRGIYAATGLEDPKVLSRALSMVELGEQARVLPTVPLKLLVVDGCRALLPLTASAAGGYCAVVVWHSAVTEALQKLFELAWQQATPLGQPVSDGGLTEDERTLTRLLAAGMKDEAVARHLGVSLRTLRRRVSDLQERLGAASRFQLGMRAAQRGWV